MSATIYALGVDPAKEKATLCLLDQQGAVILAPFDAPASREGFALVESRLAPCLAAGDQLLVGVEASCALDDNWLAFFCALEAPFALSVMRLDAAQVRHFSGPKPLRGKTDHADARRIARFVCAYASELARFRHDPEAQAMCLAVSDRAAIVEDLTRLKNRLRDRLVLAFPEFERLMKDPASPLALAILEAAPTAASLGAMALEALAAIAAPESPSRRLGQEKAALLLAAAKSSIASQKSPMAAAVIGHLVAQIRLLRSHVAQLETFIDEYVESAAPAQAGTEPAAAAPPSIPRQIALLDTLPGVGPIVAATLVLRSQGLSRFHSAKAFAAQLAACPDRLQTGTSKDIGRLAQRGDRRARPQLFLAARVATTYDPFLAFHKWRHMRAGQGAKQAICSCMNRLARLAWTLVRDNTPYDPAKAMDQITRHHLQEWQLFLKEYPKHEKKAAALLNQALT